jgi:hypothetical protein
LHILTKVVRELMKSSTTSRRVTTDTATTLPRVRAEHTLVLHHHRPISQEASQANTADNQAITATLRLHLDSTAAVLRHSNMATANPNTEARSHNTKDTAHKLGSVDRVDQATVELLLVATDSKQVMAAQHRATMADQQTTTTTSTTRYVLS